MTEKEMDMLDDVVHKSKFPAVIVAVEDEGMPHISFKGDPRTIMSLVVMITAVAGRQSGNRRAFVDMTIDALKRSHKHFKDDDFLDEAERIMEV